MSRGVDNNAFSNQGDTRKPPPVPPKTLGVQEPRLDYDDPEPRLDYDASEPRQDYATSEPRQDYLVDGEGLGAADDVIKPNDDVDAGVRWTPPGTPPGTLCQCQLTAEKRR